MLKHNRVITLLFLVLTILFPSIVSAQAVGGQSALLDDSVSSPSSSLDSTANLNFKIKKKVIKKILERYNSPLLSSVEAFISVCEKYDLDCYLLPSIAGLESYFGHYIYPTSYNPFGWARGYMMFDNWEGAIDTVGKGLRENYINRGAESIEQIGSIYAESSSWSARVSAFVKEFEEEEQKITIFFNLNDVEL